MFASLLQHHKDRRPSDRTPLLASFHKHRNHDDHDDHSASDEDHHDDEDFDEPAHLDGEDHHDDRESYRRGDGPLLPVFAEFLGMRVES